MMIKIRRSHERGFADHGWLQSQHTFSFADYHDDHHMGFSVLRVINEDKIKGGAGFATHGHRNMEIISYVIEGAVEHKDSMGHHTIIRPGEVQRMSAGTGIRHSEFNHCQNQTTHFLQIWILPEQENLPPSYDQKSFAQDFINNNNLTLVGSKEGRNGSITIHQDVNIYVGHPTTHGETIFQIAPQRSLWVQVIKGGLQVGDKNLNPGDGAAIQNTERLTLRWKKGAEFIVFDLPTIDL